jgi:hypothetical protein
MAWWRTRYHWGRIVEGEGDVGRDVDTSYGLGRGLRGRTSSLPYDTRVCPLSLAQRLGVIPVSPPARHRLHRIASAGVVVPATQPRSHLSRVGVEIDCGVGVAVGMGMCGTRPRVQSPGDQEMGPGVDRKRLVFGTVGECLADAAGYCLPLTRCRSGNDGPGSSPSPLRPFPLRV